MYYVLVITQLPNCDLASACKQLPIISKCSFGVGANRLSKQSESHPSYPNSRSQRKQVPHDPACYARAQQDIVRCACSQKERRQTRDVKQQRRTQQACRM